MRSGIEEVLKVGIRAPSADNTQPWRFLVGTQSIKVCYDSERASKTNFGFDHPATLMAIGGVAHNLTHFLENNGVEFRAHYPCDETSRVYVEFELLSDVAEFSAGREPAPLVRHTNRGAYRKEAVPSGLLQAFSGNDLVRSTTDRTRICAIAELVRQAAEIRFQLRDEHESLMSNLRFSEHEVAKGDGLDIRTIDLPPGGALFMRFISDWRRMALLNRFQACKIMARLDSSPLAQAPLVLEIARGQGVRAGIEAGKVLSEVWTHLNKNGVAVHPYFVVTEQVLRARSGRMPAHLKSAADRLVRAADSLFELGSDKDLCMLLRTGYPVNSHPVRSMRLPLEQVTTLT